jgi:very-short-patch-repair endonuclease
VHVAVERNACQLRRPRDAHARLREADALVHWRTRTGGSRLTVDPIEAVLDLAACSGPELAAASAESLWRQRPHLAPRLLRAIAGLAEPFRWVEGSCESGTEFLTRMRLGRRGIALRPQVVISDVGRVDFVLGERLVIEVDGAQYHTDPEQFEADRRRDAVLSSLGFRVLRFSYRQVMERWQEVEAAVIGARARGDHL